ncbi:MAG TPA: hypothetical protein VF676_03185 [Flavobacterium sp.]|jgi:hypothetical protein
MNIQPILEDFIKVCKLAKVDIKIQDITVEILLAGDNHLPKKLPSGKMAVYIFTDPQCNICYKVGKVGRNSNARYQAQHYSPFSSKSNLAKSILNDDEINEIVEVQLDIGSWIRKNTTRTNLLIDAQKGILVLNLLEAFVQNRLKPKYEGFKSQNINNR